MPAHASQALELSKMQEQKLQLEQQAKIKEYEAELEKIKVNSMQVAGDEKRKTMQEETR